MSLSVKEADKPSVIIEKSEQIAHQIEKLFLIFLNQDYRDQYYAHEAKISWKYRRACLFALFVIWVIHIPLDLNLTPVKKYLGIRIMGIVLLLPTLLWATFASTKSIAGISFAKHSESIISTGVPMISLLYIIEVIMQQDPDSISIELYLMSISIFLLFRIPFWKALITSAIFNALLLAGVLVRVKPNRDVTVLTIIYFLMAAFSSGFAAYAFHKKLRSSFIISRLSTATTTFTVHTIMKESNKITLMFRDKNLERAFWHTRWNKNKSFARKTLSMSIGSVFINTVAYYMFHVDTQHAESFWLIRAVMVFCTIAFIVVTYLQLSPLVSATATCILLGILYGGFQVLEYLSDSAFVQQLYRLSIINVLLYFLAMQCMYFITYSLVCTAVLILHSGLCPTWYAATDIAFCYLLTCLVYYMLESESRRSFLWRHFCTPGHEAEIMRSTIIVSPSFIAGDQDLSPKTAWHQDL